MQFLNGITILLVFQLAGEITSVLLKLPIPGPVIGMGYLFVGLLVYRRVPIALEVAATGLLSHLSLLFVPAGVGLMVYFDYIAREWLPITIAVVISTLFTLGFSALLMQSLQRLFKRSS
ncbi:MAG: hypothetical protein RLZZ422_570 [Pseudomonadota bacterium]|jgi:holin-like protein